MNLTSLADLFPPISGMSFPTGEGSGGAGTDPAPRVMNESWTRPADDLGSNFAGNWRPRNGGSNTDLDVGGGTIYDGVTTHVVPDTSLTVHASSLNYIYLKCTLSPTLVDGYVTGGTIDGSPDEPEIVSSTSVQSNTNTLAYILLCTWQAGALVTRYEWFSFSCELTNQNTGDTRFLYWNS